MSELPPALLLSPNLPYLMQISKCISSCTSMCGHRNKHKLPSERRQVTEEACIRGQVMGFASKQTPERIFLRLLHTPFGSTGHKIIQPPYKQNTQHHDTICVSMLKYYVTQLPICGLNLSRVSITQQMLMVRKGM